jgi:hypothetical protein
MECCASPKLTYANLSRADPARRILRGIDEQIAKVPTVWDSWQRHLGAPELVKRGDGTYRWRGVR